MEPCRKRLEAINEPIVRGFVLTTILLLGVGLEQGLLGSPHNYTRSILFLTGNILGLPLGVLTWQYFSPLSNIPLFVWPLEGLFVCFSLCTTCLWLSFAQGMLLGPMIIHLALLSFGEEMKGLIFKVGVGIALGNAFLFVMNHVPYPIGLILFGISLAAWRVSRPLPDSKTKLVLKPVWHVGLAWFWLFSFGFYTLGGLYYTFLDITPTFSHPLLVDLASRIFYLAGITLAIVMRYGSIRLSPYLAVAIMGLALVAQLARTETSAWSLSLMDLSFGIMDTFTVAAILALTQNATQAALAFAVYPASIIAGLLLNERIQQPILSYQWSLSLLFLTIIPINLYLRASTLREKHLQEGQNEPLALPAPADGHSQKIPSSHCSQLANNPIPMNTPKALSPTDLGLSLREQQVFCRLIQDKKLKEIGDELGLAVGTIKTLCSRIYEKAGVKGKKELLKLYSGHASQRGNQGLHEKNM